MNSGNTFYALLKRLLHISYLSLKLHPRVAGNYRLWCERNRAFNRRLNSTIFNYLATQKAKASTKVSRELRNQYILDLINELLIDHYKSRAAILVISEKLPFTSSFTFVALSIVHLHISLFLSLLKKLLFAGYRFDYNISESTQSCLLLLNFPEQTFSLPSTYKKGDKLSGPYSSFAEHLVDSNDLASDSRIISVGEYKRHSKRDSSYCTGLDIDNPRQIDRVIAVRNWKFLSWYEDVSAIFNVPKAYSWSVCGGLPLILRMKGYFKILESLKYVEIIRNIELSCIKIEQLFAPPFFRAGLVGYNPELYDKYYSYSYSSNVFVLPAITLSNRKSSERAPIDYWKFISELNISALGLFGNVVGFSQVLSDVDVRRKLISDKFDIEFPVRHSEDIPDKIGVLGFERELANQNIIPARSLKICVFDIPPESAEAQMRQIIFGNTTSDFSFVETFLLDIAEIAVQLNCHMILKPKYALGNYMKRYNDTLEALIENYKGCISLVDPYTRMGDLVETVDAVVAMPFTSAATFANAYGKPALYYIPDAYQHENWDIEFDSEIVQRKERLLEGIKLIIADKQAGKVSL